MDTHTPDNLTPVQVQILNALAQGATMTGAAAAAGVHRTTIYNWINHQPDFEAAVDEAKAEYSATLRDELQVLSRDALATLRSLLDDPATPPALRFKVAMAILQRPQSPDRDWRLPEPVEEPQAIDVRAELEQIELEGEAVAEYLRRKHASNMSDLSNPSNVSNVSQPLKVSNLSNSVETALEGQAGHLIARGAYPNPACRL